MGVYLWNNFGALFFAIFVSKTPSWTKIKWSIFMYWVTQTGLTVGFHRLFAHKSFEAHPILEYILAFTGTMNGSG